MAESSLYYQLLNASSAAIVGRVGVCSGCEGSGIAVAAYDYVSVDEPPCDLCGGSGVKNLVAGVALLHSIKGDVA